MRAFRLSPAMPQKPSPAAPPRRTSRARITEVAASAGVSTATVDRVLNRREGVRGATAERVWRAAEALDYLSQSALHLARRSKPERIELLLPAGTNRYLRMIGDYIDFAKEQLAPFNVRVRCHFIEGFNPAVLAERLLHYGRHADGVVFMALAHPLVREAVRELAQEGVPCVTLISDLTDAPRVAYVGLDNHGAGRTAGWLLGRLIGSREGKIGLIAGSLSYRAHEEREMGFLHIAQEMFPRIEVIGLREGHDDQERNYLQTRNLLERYADLVGIYNIGGASDGVARALKEAGRDQKVAFIGHGLTPDTRALLIDGTLDAVLTQTPQSMVMNCARIFSNLRERRDALAGIEALRVNIVLRENLP